MKRKTTAAVVLAVAMLINGCAERREAPASSADSSSGETSSAVSVQSTQSSKGGAPLVVAPSFSGAASISEPTEISSSIPEEPSMPVDIPEESDTALYTSAAELLTREVANGETLRIESGEAYKVSEELAINSGGSLIIENGGRLYVSGTVKSDGDIIIHNGGKLELTDDGAFVEGNGSLRIEGSFDDIDCTYGDVRVNIVPPERVVENGVTTVGGVVIANKAIKLPPEYGSELSDGDVKSEVYNALMEMNAHSNHWYSIVSAYRSYSSQERIFNGWVDVYGFEEASTISSQAGHSEHQTGLTMDLDSLEQSYGDTSEGIWLSENCYKYGFIIRYPKGKDEVTGYAYEPWHVRYLGKSTAKLVFNSGLTLEEFLNVEGGKTVID